MLYTSINEWKKHLIKESKEKDFPIIKKDSNGNVIYTEWSNGIWEKKEFDSNGNEIYFEDSFGDWVKKEFDSNGNEIYYEDSDGYWAKMEYDTKGKEIYFEDSDGVIRDNRNINERKKLNKKRRNQRNLMKNESKKEYDSNGNLIYKEDSNGNWTKYEYDSNSNLIYREDSNGNWDKYEYDSNGNEISFENSIGYWDKTEFDSEGNLIYYENSDGLIRDNRNINERKKRLVKESKGKENSISSSIKVGDKIKGSQGITKDRVGTIISIEGDMAQVDFGNGDKYGIALRRVTEGEFKKLGKSSEAKKN